MWTFNGTKLPPNVIQSKVSESVYQVTISNVQASNAGQYICTNTEQGTSSFGTLSVTGNVYFTCQ